MKPQINRSNLRKALLFAVFFFSLSQSKAQNDVMMQAFYWDVPVNASTLNGSWWDTLTGKMPSLKSAGFTGLWVPPPSKGNFGIYDMGYGLYDHYDLGNYNQKGTTETRFGSRSELNSMLTAAHSTTGGASYMNIYADIILNHIYTGESESQSNPAVKQYVFDKAYRNSTQYQAYPTNEITWVIPNAAAGDYYIQIAGYLLNYGGNVTERGYDVFIDWTGASPNGSQSWESEPNNGGGQFNTFPASARTVSGHMQNSTDIDEYKITLSSAHDIVIKLVAKKEGTNGSGQWEWQWAAQENGYYPVAVWKNGSNLASTTLQARTNTNVTYPNHTGSGEANYSWTYTDFHPVDNSDWLGFPGSDEIITNTKFFGNDLNTFSTTVKTRLKNWGYWMANTVGFDGFRLDFVRGFQESFVAEWVNNLPLLSGSQRFIVGEYWGADYRIKNWVNTVATSGADVDGFDFPLKNSLKDLCNGNGSSFDMRWLNHAGLVRNNAGNSLPGTSVVTFADNHDTGKEHDKWITKDHKLAYAYMLTHEGRPCVFYPHYYGVTQVDAHNSYYTTTAPASLRTDINKLIQVRKTYLGGSLTVLSETGNPYPSADAYSVYIARRQGNGTKGGAIICINNHDSNTKGLWVDVSPAGYENLAGKTLVNAINGVDSVYVYPDGRAYFSAPPRGYTIWVKKTDYVAISARISAQAPPKMKELAAIPADENFSVYPNPANSHVRVNISVKENSTAKIYMINTAGNKISELHNGRLEGKNSFLWDCSAVPGGIYFCVVSTGKRIYRKKIIVSK
ncbi:MAG: T9SS type A sorting domain-containing protein [Chitinophagaceae bacterium]|nr:T9SS type A sorting domain-containing protein [Chitinophagaceae bacterium]